MPSCLKRVMEVSDSEDAYMPSPKSSRPRPAKATASTSSPVPAAKRVQTSSNKEDFSDKTQQELFELIRGYQEDAKAARREVEELKEALVKAKAGAKGGAATPLR